LRLCDAPVDFHVVPGAAHQLKVPGRSHNFLKRRRLRKLPRPRILIAEAIVSNKEVMHPDAPLFDATPVVARIEAIDLT